MEQEREMSLTNMREEYMNTPKRDILEAVTENALYGFLGSILIVFIAERMDIAVLVGYMTYYFYLGKVVNRPKYVTSLGKFIIFPIPTSLGAYLGYKIALIASNYL